MLQDFQIKGFRGFCDLTLDRLGRVNLVVGKNNVGKSSLLEALDLYAQGGAPDALLGLPRTREQLRSGPANELPDVRDAVLFAVQRLFYGGGSNRDTITPIRMGPISIPEQHVSIALDWQESDPKLVVRSGRLGQFHLSLYELATGEGIPRRLRYRWSRESDHGQLQFSFAESADEGRLWELRPVWLRTNDIATVYVRPEGVPASLLVVWWRRITLTPLENVVLEALRIIEPNLERLSIVTDDRGRATVLVLLEGETRPVPLSSLGGGMNRVLGIVLALIMAKGGVLLIDEVENGLHYSIQADLWRLILRTAEQLDVQVFASSHSWDSIEAFQKASVENQAVQGYLIRLLRKDGDVIANILDERKLGIATRQEIEVR